MSGHLLAMAVGPVQEFIAAARRTRDLWFGSWLLSEASRAAASAVSMRARLIFPASAEATNVANVILAEVAREEDPASVAAAAKIAAQKKWRSVADNVFHEYSGVIRRDIWDDQVNDVIEFYAAWTTLAGDYAEARRRVMRLLAGRKNCRDFIAANGRPGVPKSSLDGLRESVLKDPNKESWPENINARLRVRQGEQLDVVGLVKRVAEGTRPYPSVSRVAADPWVRGHEGQLSALIAACERLDNSVVRRLDLSAHGHPHYHAFPFEGTAVFQNRHHELEEEVTLTAGALRSVTDALAHFDEPNPYLAVLVADGDRIGEVLSRLLDADQHRAFSATLADFGEQARGIVHTYRGVLVYAGGDDVLAFVPVDQCLDCARALHDSFGELVKDWVKKASVAITLSVGVAIGHFLENLEDLREYGRAAEKNAKQPDRDGLAVHLHKRGGSPVRIRARWTPTRPAPEQWSQAPDTRITGLAALLAERLIPNRLATDLKSMADLYSGWHGDYGTAIRQDILRVIAAKQPGAGGSVRERLQPILDRVTDAASLRQLAEELLIARQIATACRQAAGTRNRSRQ